MTPIFTEYQVTLNYWDCGRNSCGTKHKTKEAAISCARANSIKPKLDTKRLTKEDNALHLMMYRNGKSIEEISTETGRSKYKIAKSVRMGKWSEEWAVEWKKEAQKIRDGYPIFCRLDDDRAVINLYEQGINDYLSLLASDAINAEKLIHIRTVWSKEILEWRKVLKKEYILKCAKQLTDKSWANV